MLRCERKTKLHNSLPGAALAVLVTVGLPAAAFGQVDAAPPDVAVAAPPPTIPAVAPIAAWTPRDVAALADVLRHADAHGLDASALLAEVEAAAPGDNSRLDHIAFLYAQALALGAVDPAQLHEDFSLATNQRDLMGELDRALGEDRLADWLASLPPRDEDYRTLSAAYLEARAAAEAHPASKALHDKARTLALNLERLRWLARTAPPTRIDVNIAAARLWFFKDGAMLDTRKVVAGAPDHETPMIQASFSRIVTNPPWIVPTSIAKREILPKGAGYMARHGMRLVNDRVVQDPGPDAALGLVKFDLQDDEAIYLHDTPVQSAFDRKDRHLSHGCVRVEDAVGFAHIVADAFGVADRFEDRLASGDTSSVSLGAEVPVRMLYETAYVDDGQVRFAPDAYGWDADLADALGMGDGLAAPIRAGA